LRALAQVDQVLLTFLSVKPLSSYYFTVLQILLLAIPSPSTSIVILVFQLHLSL